MTQIHGVILGVDGTLVDSNDAHAKAWVEAMEEFGYKVAFEKVRPLIGMGGDKVLPETIGIEKDSEEGKILLSLIGFLYTTKPGFSHLLTLLISIAGFRA